MFVDECLGRVAVPEALRKAGVIVVAHHHLFASGVSDEHWLGALAAHPDWLVFTKDRQRPLRRQGHRERSG